MFLFFGICYWAVNFFVKQVTEAAFDKFRLQIKKETESALSVFRDRLAEQIVLQGNRSDALAKLYSLLIDIARNGRDLVSDLTKTDLPQAQFRLRSIKDATLVFSDTHQRQGLYFNEELIRVLTAFTTELKQTTETVDKTILLAMSGASDPIDAKKTWVAFEDRMTGLMNTMRNEFRKRQNGAVGNITMDWLIDTPSKENN